MGGFLDWFFAFLTTMIDGVWQIISGIFGGIFKIFNLVDYITQFNTFKGNFGVLDWIFAILAFILVMAIWAIVICMIVLVVRKYIRFRKSIVSNEDLLEEVAKLHKNVLNLTKEKDRILALKIGENSISQDALNAIYNDEEPEAIEEEEEAAAAVYAPRFSRLEAIDRKYQYYITPEYRTEFTLVDLCNDFRNFACSRMGLYYEAGIIRCMFAGLAATKLILLQGISGTGKTSLPYAMGKFFENDATIVSVQPSWRDRTELFGYFNEFSKKFNETEVLRTI